MPDSAKKIIDPKRMIPIPAKNASRFSAGSDCDGGGRADGR